MLNASTYNVGHCEAPLLWPIIQEIWIHIYATDRCCCKQVYIYKVSIDQYPDTLIKLITKS
jgi:hypothetical protein